MKLVLITQYFSPDAAPTGLMAKRVVDECAAQGHEVIVLCAKKGSAKTANRVDPKRSKKLDRVLQIRAPGFGRKKFLFKVVDNVRFYLGVTWRLLLSIRRSDRIIPLTTPPFLGAGVRLISKIHGADRAHWTMDLYPDVMLAHGMLRLGGWKAKALQVLTRVGFGGKRCALIWALGPDMHRRVRQHLDSNTTSGWIPLWENKVKGKDLDESANLIRNERGWVGNDLVVMYSGNLGLGHLFGEILEDAKGLTPSVGKRSLFQSPWKRKTSYYCSR